MVIGSPGTYPAEVRNNFGLYYDEDDDGDGRSGPTGSQQLTDYHYTKSTHPASDFTTGYMTGEFWLSFASCGIFDEHGNHDAIQCGSRHDYHCKCILPEYEISGCKAHHDSSASGIFEDDTDPKDAAGACLGSGHDYHSLMSNPIDEIMAEKWEVASMTGIFTFQKTSFTTFYAIGSLHPTITIGCMV